MQSSLPLVVDADALNVLAEHPMARKNMIITPHPGEAARLLGCSTERVQSDRFLAARELEKSYLATTVLKGSGTLICHPDHELHLCSEGGSELGTAGSGDVLTGIIAGLRAQGHSDFLAASLGVCIHAGSGALAAQEGSRGIIASDLIDKIRPVLNL